MHLSGTLWKASLSVLLILGISSCHYTIRVRDGETAFDRKQYALAVNFLTKDFARAKSRVQKGRIALKLGQSYDRLNDPAGALPWFRIAWDNQAGIDGLLGYARCLQMLERYADAREAYISLGEEIGSTYEYRRQIEACRLAEQWLMDTSSSAYAVAEMPMNSPYNDYAPTRGPGDRIYYASERPVAGQEQHYPWTGKPYADIYPLTQALSTSDDWLAVINSPAHEATLVFAPDGQSLYFTRCGGQPETEDQYCRIYQSNKTADGWSPPAPLGFCSGPVNYGHPAITPDGQRMIFVSDDPSGYGGFDLYESIRTLDGWSEPAILPPNLNSIGDELFPWLDGDTLYFASDGLPGMGGLDIFRSYRLTNRSWSVPVNLRAPINSGADDLGLIWGALNAGPFRQGWFSSSRPGGKGGDDVYQVRERPLPPPPPPPVVTDSDFRWNLEIHTLTRILRDPADPNSQVLGRTYLPGVRVVVHGSADTAFISPDGHPHLLVIHPGDSLELEATRPDYLSTRLTFHARNLGKDPSNPVQVIPVELILDKRFINQEIVLQNIYYDFDRWDIRTDARPELNRLAGILKANPDIQIELASHTDCRGGTLYNQELSQRRAQSAVDFLTREGIDPRRMRARGYGESRPAVTCSCNRCTEAEHQANRRTTFRILQD